MFFFLFLFFLLFVLLREKFLTPFLQLEIGFGVDPVGGAIDLTRAIIALGPVSLASEGVEGLQKQLADVYVRLLAGRLFNLLGVPGVVRNCDYEATNCKAAVSVRVGQLFTLVRVNGLDVYFHRLTGNIDGVRFSPTSDCRLDQNRQSSDFGAPPVDSQGIAHTGNLSERSE